MNEGDHHCTCDPVISGLAMETEEGEVSMVLNEQGITEHERQIDVINAIPSNKIDDDPLKNISDEAIQLYDKKHLRDLRDQVMAYDEEELRVVAEAIIERGWTYFYNPFGDYVQRLYNQKEATKVINQA